MNFFVTDPSNAKENVPCLHPSGTKNTIENAVFKKNYSFCSFEYYESTIQNFISSNHSERLTLKNVLQGPLIDSLDLPIFSDQRLCLGLELVKANLLTRCVHSF
jgi:hypothetical protein